MTCDLIIIVFVIINLFNGWKKGFVRSAYSIISLIACVIATYIFNDTVSELIANTNWGIALGEYIASSYINFVAKECTQTIISIVSSIIIYFSLKILLRFTLRMLDTIASLPLINFFNRTLGLVLNGIFAVIWIILLTNFLYLLPQTQPYILESDIINKLGILFIS